MKIYIFLFSLGASLLFSFSQPASSSAKLDRVITDGEVAQILKTIPDQYPVPMPNKRRILVFSETNGYRHVQSIPAGKKWFESLVKKLPQFQIVISDQLENFESENLKKFDAVCFLCTCGEVFLPYVDDFKKLDDAAKKAAKEREERLKQNLVDFLKNGGGWIGFHSASDTYKECPEYLKIAGGTFDGHPWTSNCEVSFKVEDKTSPLTKETLTGKDFTFLDEIYQYRPNSFDRNRSRVLLSLDWLRTSHRKKTYRKILRPDFDFPISWVHSYGKGRVFYSSLGHNAEIFWNKDLMAYHLLGILYALGDLPLDDTPQGPLFKPIEGYAVKTAPPVDVEGLKKLIFPLESLDFSKKPEALKILRESIDNARMGLDQSKRKEVVDILVSGIGLTGNSLSDKKIWLEAANELQDASLIPPLLNGLNNPATVFSACFGLAGQKIQPQITGIKEKLKTAPPDALVQILSYISSPEWKLLVNDITPFLSSESPELVRSAMDTLAKMATPKAYESLANYWTSQKSPESRIYAAEALLEAADLLKDFDKSKPQMNQIMQDPLYPEPIRIVATRFFFFGPSSFKKENEDQVAALLQAAMQVPGSPTWYGVLQRVLNRVDYPDKARTLINNSFATLPSHLKKMVISSYASEELDDLIQESCEALKTDPTLGGSCAYAAWKFPDPRWVEPLVEAATKLQGPDRLFVVNCLAQMRGAPTEAALTNVIQNKYSENSDVINAVAAIRKMTMSKPVSNP